MPRQLSAAVVIFMSLAVILHDGRQIRAKAFPETRVSLPMTATTGQATAKPLVQPADQGPHETLAARSTEGHVTSPIATSTSNSESSTHTTVKTPVTIKSSPFSSQRAQTLAPSSHSHPITEATIGPGSATRAQPSITHPSSTTGTRTSTVSHTTGKATGPGDHSTLPKTLSLAPQKSTTSQKPTPTTHALDTPAVTQSGTQEPSPATTVPRPTLVPQSSPAKTGIYQVLNGSSLCIKAEIGIQLIVQENESVLSPLRYFNLDPNTTHASGNCGCRKSNLFLKFQGGFVNLTFTKEENSYYISEVGVYLTVSNPEKVYQGLKSSVMMFETVIGHSFKCVSEQSLQLSAQLQLKTTNVQLQAFDFEGDEFGNVDECSSDYTIVLPVIGGILVCLCLVGMGVYAIRLRRQLSAYQQL